MHTFFPCDCAPGAFLGCRLFPSCRGKRSGREVEQWRAGVAHTPGPSGRRGAARKLTLMCEVETPNSFRVHAQGDLEVGELLRLALPRVILRAAQAWRYKHRMMGARTDASFDDLHWSASSLVSDVSPHKASSRVLSPSSNPPVPAAENTTPPGSSSSGCSTCHPGSDAELSGSSCFSFAEGFSSTPSPRAEAEMLDRRPGRVTPVEIEDEKHIPLVLRPLSWLPRLDRLKTGQEPWRDFLPCIACAAAAWEAETRSRAGGCSSSTPPADTHSQGESASPRKAGGSGSTPKRLANRESHSINGGLQQTGAFESHRVLCSLADRTPPLPWDWTSGWVEAPHTERRSACSTEASLSSHPGLGQRSYLAPRSSPRSVDVDPVLSGGEKADPLRYLDGCVFRLEAYEFVIESLVEQTKEWCSVAPIPGLTLRFFRQYYSDGKKREDSFFITDRQVGVPLSTQVRAGARAASSPLALTFERSCRSSIQFCSLCLFTPPLCGRSRLPSGPRDCPLSFSSRSHALLVSAFSSSGRDVGIRFS